MAEPLHRSRDDRMLAGVAGGVAETLDADPSLVRIIWALLAIVTGGIAILVYIVMAIVVPEGPVEPWTPAAPAPGGILPNDAGVTAPTAPSAADAAASGSAMPPFQSRAEWRAARRARRREAMRSGEAGLIFGVVLIVIGALFLAREAIPWFDFHLWWPIGLIVLGALLLAAATLPRRPGR